MATSTDGTDLGLASTPDGGATWIYRGVMLGLDLPAADRREALPKGSSTQQFGGATWWRPAVISVRDEMGEVYHGFFSQWEQPHEWGYWKVIHYMSRDLKNWNFVSFVRNSTCPPQASTSAHCQVAYDSCVFQISDGRYVLFSGGPSPGFTGPHPELLCSWDLYAWTTCESTLQLYEHFASMNRSPGVEGLHVTGRNRATVTWEGYSWMNWEGRGPTKGRPGMANMARSKDGGLHWEASEVNLYRNSTSRRPFDGDIAFQGPMLLQPDGAAYVLYFTEFDTNGNRPYDVNGSFNVQQHRSVLQMARVRLDATGWPFANRSEEFEIKLAPPIDAAPPPKAPMPTVWSVARAEAAVIALAEINRWWPLAIGTVPGQGPNTNSTQQLWRDPLVAQQEYFTSIQRQGRDQDTVWRLEFEHTCLDQQLRRATVSVLANGTVSEISSPNHAGPMQPKQWRRLPPISY